MKKSHLAVLALAVLTLTAAGCTRDAVEQQAEAPAPEGPLRYEIAVGTEGFTPATVQAHTGEAVTLVFTRVTDATCGNAIVVPSHNIEVKLPLHDPVEVTLIPENAGEITFACGMDMLQGKIVVD